MSITEQFLLIYPYVCLVMVNAPIIAIVVPNSIIDTDSPNKHWIAVCFIAAGLFGSKGNLTISFLILLVMFAGVIVHYLRNRKMVNTVRDVLPEQTPELFKRVK